MAEPQDSWADGLSPSVRVAFEWALASTGERVGESRKVQTQVGTAALLVGIVRSHEGYSEPEALLQHFGLTREQLFDALIVTTRESSHEQQVDLNPTVPRRSRLKDFPALNPPATQAIVLGGQAATASDGRIHLPMLFGGVLDLGGTHAHDALSGMLAGVIPLEQIRESYFEWLAEGGRRLYPSFLAERYPGGRPPNPETPPPSSVSDLGRADCHLPARGGDAGRPRPAGAGRRDERREASGGRAGLEP